MFKMYADRGASSFEESASYHKVLQGQEILGFRTPHSGSELSNSLRNQQVAGIGRTHTVSGSGSGGYLLAGKSSFPYMCNGFDESNRFSSRVLQGQEIFPFRLMPGGHQQHFSVPAKENGNFGVYNTSSHVSGGHSTSHHSLVNGMVAKASSPSSVIMFQQPSYHQSTNASAGIINQREGSYHHVSATDWSNNFTSSTHHHKNQFLHCSYDDDEREKIRKEDGVATPFVTKQQLDPIASVGNNGSSYRLFGFSLLDPPSVSDEVSETSQSPSPAPPAAEHSCSNVSAPLYALCA